MNTDNTSSGQDHQPVTQQIISDDQYYRSIIENNSFYVIKTDLEGRYTYMNPFFCHMFQLRNEDWVGRPSLDLIIAEDHPACILAIEACVAIPESSHWVILRKPFGDSFVSTQWEFKLLINEQGDPVEFLCIGHDITSLVLRQRELEDLVDITSQQNKKLVNFTYIVSHNIRSHVANIIGLISLNEKGTEDDKIISWTILKKSIANLDSTIHNLTEIINIESNTNLPLINIQLRPEIERIINSIKVLFDNAAANIHYNFDYDAQIHTNLAYLESILLNLLTNSLKYKSPLRSLEIDISLFKVDNYQVLVFKDNGLGINMRQNGDKVFGMYKTFNGNLDAKGLGLFIIKTQIEALGGTIEVDSRLDQYTTFKVYFKIS
jgi:PAS domain S-box-containing protein